jgi:uncharacterized protein YggE
MKTNISTYKIKPGSLLTALCLTLCLLSLTAINPAMAQEQRLRTLTVTGRGIEVIPTNLTLVRLGVEVQGQTAAGVQEEAAKRLAAVVSLLRSRNVQKLETTEVTLNPSYNYQNNQQKLIGYVGSNNVSFRINTQSAGTLLDDAVKAGATKIEGVSFIADDSAIAQARQQALRKATQDAQTQADAVLGALNFKRSDVVSIEVNGAIAPQTIFMPRLAAARGGMDATTPVVGGEQQVEASVTLQISY